MKNWKKTVSIIAVICLMIGMFAACAKDEPAPEPTPPPASEDTGSAEATVSEFEGAPTFDLKLAHPQPAGSATDLGYNKFADLMDEYSEGTIKTTIYPANSLINSNEAVEAIRNGTVDIAQLSSGDLATVVPAMNLIEVPGSYSQANTDYVLGLTPILQETLEPFGIHFLSPQPGTPSWMFSNLKQIKTPEDMAGLKVRASGKYGGEAITMWGGSPVTITLADLTTAMERNTVDVVLTPGLGAYSNGWYELEHYITVSDVTTLMALMAMNLDIWNEMTPAQQDAVTRACQEGAMLMYEETMREVEEGFSVMEAYGNEIYTLTPEENLAFKNMLDPIRQTIIDEVGEPAEKLEAVLKQFR